MSTALEVLTDHYRRRDQAARAWKANGGKVVGYLCDNVPEELILAAGFFPYRLSGDPRAGRQAVERYIQPFALPFSARSQRPDFAAAMLNMLLDGTFEFVDFLIVPHTRKAIQAFYRELSLAGAAHADLRLPEMFFLDRSYLPFFMAELFNRQRLLELKAKLEEWSGQTLTDSTLAAAIEITNESRALLQRLAELRATRPSRVSGVDALHAIGSSTVMLRQEHNDLLRRFLDEDDHPPRSEADARVFIGGSPHDHPQLYEIIESCDATVVSEDHCWGTRLAEFPVDTAMDPFEALADRYHRKPACSIAFPMASLVDACTRRAVQANVDGAIFFVMRADAGHIWDTPDEIRALADNGIPSLYLADQPYWTDRPDELRHRVSSFLGSLERAAKVTP
jgi:benzoyl-CoA reductase/2-hydroxyglutaryl-CoA dehydratase subunit BcrC/BadD/HgdB